MVKQKYCLSLHHQTKNLVFGESVAQQVEHNTFNVGVPGSSPGGFTSFFMLSGRVITLLLCFFMVAEEEFSIIGEKAVEILKNLSQEP